VSDNVADELAVRNLIARLAHAADSGTLETYASMIAEDARWVMPGAQPVDGKPAILEAAIARRATGTTGPGSHTQHLITTVAVTVDGDTAHGVSYWQFFGDTTSTPALRLLGVYRDTFRRTADGWVFAERISSRE
jgi:uncharacterized protein (TIGR02246 family)